MIEAKRLADIFKRYMSDVRRPELGQQELQHKGHFTRIFPVPSSSFKIADFDAPVSMDLHMHRLEIETRFVPSVAIYVFRIQYRWNDKSFLCHFEIPGEAFSLKAMEYHFAKAIKQFRENGLIRLTDEELAEQAYKQAKAEFHAKLYGAGAISKEAVEVAQGKFDMALLKMEIDKVKQAVAKDFATDSSNVLNQIMKHAEQATAHEAVVNNSTFHQVKQLAQDYFDKHGKFPEPDSFIGIGMKVAIDPAVPDGVVVFHTTQPPLQQQKTFTFKDAELAIQKFNEHVSEKEFFEQLDAAPSPSWINDTGFKPPKATPKTVQHYGNSGDELRKVVPALDYRGVPCPEPATCAEWNSNSTLLELIIHLNDSHRWPRSGTDPNPAKRRNIADWIDEVCLLHGLDQSFHPNEAPKPSARNWKVMKKKNPKLPKLKEQ